MTKDEILNVIENTKTSRNLKLDTLLFAIFNVDDWQWLQELCIKYASNDDEDIAGLAITGLGHIARMHGKLDLKIVIPFLEQIKNGASALSGRAEDSLEDIEIFLS